MPADRDAALKKADQLLKQGKLAGAIDEYVRLVADRPGDWSAVNALGDLYVKAGDTDRAVAQFIQAADQLYGEGFLPRAAALYKKALKVRPDHDHAIWQLADIAGRHGLAREARSYYAHLIGARRAAGEESGVIDCVVRLGQLQDADVDARMAAASALIDRGESKRAAKLVTGAADILTKEGRFAEALDRLRQAARLDPEDQEIAERLAAAVLVDPPASITTVEIVESETVVSVQAAAPVSGPEAFEAAGVVIEERSSFDTAMALEGLEMDPAAVLAELSSASDPESEPTPAREPQEPEPSEPLSLEAVFEALRNSVTREQEKGSE